MTTASLDEIQGALLTYTELQAQQMEADAEHPVNQLLVDLGGYGLRIFCANEVLSEDDEPHSVSSVFYFICHLPNPPSPAVLPEVRRMLGILNHLLPVGTLELQAEDGLFFRHMLLTEEQVLDGLLALDLIVALEQILPPLFDWLQQVFEQVPPIEKEQQMRIKNQFQTLLQRVPVFEPIPLAKLPATQQRSLLWKSWWVSGWLLAALSGFLAVNSGPLWLGGTVFILACLGTSWWLVHQNQKQSVSQQQLKQTQFSWQLLEVEAIKLAYQEHALEQHRLRVQQKLTLLSNQPAAYPSDIVRLRFQIRFLRTLQSHLFQRSHHLKMRRQEVESNRSQLLKPTLELPLLKPTPDSELSSEDMLMQNLLTTLDYLDFSVKMTTLKNQFSPVLLVQMRDQLPPLSIRWLRNWHLGKLPPQHTWLLCVDQTLPLQIPEEAWPRVHEVLRVFNRFLPLGALICDYQHQRVYLRYRFVRLKGDLSAMLVMEVMEVMATFGEQLLQRLQECVTQHKHLETILDEAEADFHRLQNS